TGIGLLFIGTESLLFVATIILGIACASGFSLAMMFFTLRTNTVQEAAQLSGMAQSFGYLLAASGPLLFGKLYDLTNDWNVSLLVLIGFAVLLAVTGSVAGKKRTLQVNSSH
ncbi:MAG TPA: MFS transporter, partial [Savagea sp.]